jgi:hypothetical protein
VAENARRLVHDVLSGESIGRQVRDVYRGVIRDSLPTSRSVE